MKVAVGLRPLPNKTNIRSLALSEALQEAGHEVSYQGRGEPVKGAELYVQTGFARSVALVSAIDQGIPYIIMEASPFREWDLNEYSSWGYGGFQGGAYRPTPPEEERPKPTLQPMHDGPDLIIGQKPTDHSLRGSDHVQWIVDKRLALPEADFRPHPLMVGDGTLEAIEEVLPNYGRVFTYSSTVGVDAVISGCQAFADCELSYLRYLTSGREDFLHTLSWAQGGHAEYQNLLGHILGGYEEARERARDGRVESPREKVNGYQVCNSYYQRVLC